MSYLIDTNVISAIAPARKDRPQSLVDWLDRASDRLFLSVITVTEIRDGIAKAEREGASRKAAALETWWNEVQGEFEERILPFDLASATLAGVLTDRARAAGVSPGFADVAIAATAKVNGLVLLTRNVKDYASFGVPLVDPFVNLPQV